DSNSSPISRARDLKLATAGCRLNFQPETCSGFKTISGRWANADGAASARLVEHRLNRRPAWCWETRNRWMDCRVAWISTTGEPHCPETLSQSTLSPFSAIARQGVLRQAWIFLAMTVPRTTKNLEVNGT